MIDAQFNLYSTHFVSENDFYYDCLHYKVMEDIFIFGRIEGFQRPYQIIEYCIRPLENENKTIEGMIKGNILANFTFEQLSKLNISVEVLLSWSAPVDLVEQYQIYIDKLNSSLKSEMFYQCSPPWFGVFCQYTFNLDDTFNNIVKKTFAAKEYMPRETEYVFINITNLTCYVHLECNRGPAPICLDWREICNGQIDCIGSGVDEMNCFELEINECEINEYQCHNGMCVPEEFFNDGLFDSECLDSTDENYYREDNGRINGFVGCFVDPAFRCEDAVHPHHDLDFTCGDGQQNTLEPSAPSKSSHIWDTVKIGCRNGRDMMLRQLLLLDAEQTNLTYECWVFMSCITYAGRPPMCRDLCDGICRQPIHSKCNVSTIYVIFPLISISPSHVQSGYWTRLGRYLGYSLRREPDFYCYDVQLCPFFSPTFKIDNRTCVNRSGIILDGFNYQVRLFDSCLTVDKNGNETNCFHPSLFHCPGTSKCISKRRLLDGYVDCYGGADEMYVDSCQLNDKHRFRCTSEDKCISNILVRDGIYHCSKGEDEIYADSISLYYQNLCNGYTHMTPILIDGQNETDETNCEQWPCDNQYTRCDNAWTCRNGADEINCNRLSKCYPDHHECISPTNFEVMCLPINRSGDGKMDCLGGFDERQYCKALLLNNNYQCWNATICVQPECVDTTYCSFEQNTAFDKICRANYNISRLLYILSSDFYLKASNEFPINTFPKYKYFTLHNSNPSSSNPIHSSVISDVSTVVDKNIDFRRAWICNRGIFIYIGTNQISHCLCPPSYYGNRCQFQNQRVSLTVKFRKECFPNCHGIYDIVVMLIDQNQVIQSYEQFALLTIKNCNMKYNLNLLYKSRPKNERINYTIHIHAYNKYDLSYYTSWILPVKFLFLPVNRIAAYLIIPSHANDIIDNCSLECGDHGYCTVFINSGKPFCRCHSGWSGQQCTVRNSDCNCSPDSFCLDIVNKRSICLCPLYKYGPRCFLHSICENATCKNGGQCMSEDGQWPLNTYTCICKQGYSGNTCEKQDTQIDFSFDHIEIPQSLFLYFVTVQLNDVPMITVFSKKIPFDQDKTSLFTSLLFNLIFTRIDNEYYLVHHQVEASYIPHIPIEIKSSQRCFSIDELLDKRTLSFSLLRRVKYYHVACKERSDVTCLYDLAGYMCLCNEDRFANCLNLNFSQKHHCQQKSVCENEGECFPDRTSCPNSMMCVCNKCYFGTKCQLTTKGYGLSLDTILGYQILQHTSIPRQTVAVKVSITMTTLMFFIGLISGIVSTMTFSSKNLLEVGCGFYLRALSILSLLSATILTLKLWLIIATQSLWITNRVILWINCISMEFILRSLPAIGDWLSVCVAIERTFVVLKGVTFNKNKSKQMARWIIIGVILFTIVSIIHDPIHRRLIDDEEEKRTWCVVRYSSIVHRFNSIVHIFHFIIPFSINLISSIVIIINAARTHSNARKKQLYKQYLREQFHKQKHLILSPILLVILGFPRLIFSFLFGCMESARTPWLFLFGYFISFLPSLLMPIIFILPSEIYRKELQVILESIRKNNRRCLHLF